MLITFEIIPIIQDKPDLVVQKCNVKKIGLEQIFFNEKNKQKYV